MNSYWGNQRAYMDKDASEDEAGDDFQSQSVFAIGTDVYFNGEVTNQSITQLIRLSHSVISENTKPKTAGKQGLPVYRLTIDSEGGDVAQMLRFADFVENFILPNTSQAISVVSGMAASAASYIAIIFPVRHITRRSTIMMHQLSSGFGGTMSVIENYVKHLNQMTIMIVDDYAKATNKPKAEIIEILKREVWFSAEESLDFGLVHAIL